MTNLSKKLIRRDVVFGAQLFSNYIFERVLLIGGLSFFLTGLSSWKQKSLLPFVDISEIQFLPQGIVICFYGILAIVLGLYLFLRMFLTVGRGFNKYDKEKQRVHIFRWGFPGKNRRLESFYDFSEFDSLYLENQSFLINQNSLRLYLRLKGERKVLLTQLGAAEIRSNQEVERFAADLARFLQIPLEGNLTVEIFRDFN